MEELAMICEHQLELRDQQAGSTLHGPDAVIARPMAPNDLVKAPVVLT